MAGLGGPADPGEGGPAVLFDADALRQAQPQVELSGWIAGRRVPAQPACHRHLVVQRHEAG